MTRHALIPLAILLAAPAFAQDKPASADAPSGKMENLLQNCDAHKFETTVESTVDGKPHNSKLKMCGNEGQSDAEWIDTLKDAVKKMESNATMSESMRNQIVGAIKAEIARLEAGGTTPAAGTLPAGRSQPNAADTLANDYSVLPPLPKSNPAPTRVLNAPPTTPTAVAAEPAAVIAASNQAPAPVAAPPAPPRAKPKLSLTCISPEFPSGGPCVTISRDTFLNVKAGEPIGPGVALRFVRQGVPKAEFALGSMHKGQSLRFPLPQSVCSGVVSGEVEIAVVRDGSVVDRQGPSLLHC